MERVPETRHQRDPVFLAARDGIELVFQLGGEVVIHVLGEVAGQELGDRPAHVGGTEAAAFHFHVLAEQQGLDDRGVGRGTTDPVLFQRLDQRRFGEARRRLGEVLVGHDALERHAVAGLHRRQLAAFVVVLGALVVLAFLVHGQEAGHHHGGTAGAEHVFAAGRQVHAHGVERGRDHLAGHRALPDQLVQLALVVGEEACHLRRGAQGRGRAHRFMRFLGVLGLGLVGIGLVRQRSDAIVARDHVADFGQRILGQVDRVGTHVGDQADSAFFLADGHAFVQLLRDLHGLARGEAELARGFLLQRGGGERRGRAALALLAGHIGDVQGALRRLLDAHACRFGGVAIGHGELFELLAVQLGQACGERLGGMRAGGIDAPVLTGDEGFDFFLALDDHAQCRALHAAGGQATLHLAPQHRGQVEADQVVQRAPRLLGIDQIAGDGAWLAHGFLDRPRGDLGEDHALHRLVLDQPAFLQDLGDMPADRFTLAIRVGRQEDVVGALGGLDDGIDVLFVLLDEVVAHREVVVRIDRAFLRHQVAHMPIRGQDGEVLAEVFVDRLGLGGRFDDEQVLGHV